ncbi:MAG TPA: glycoside hydrolase 43 family protein [Tepidisphaeraceae bacterium]|nr:glycoside hydrolase 43 family protein [Tepidisphaeraceae bacterium]
MSLMNIKTSIIVCLMCAHCTAQPTTAPWIPDLGDGTFKNPVLFADYSDPDVIRVGSDFYLTASSFGCLPGLPILHSRNLVNWKIINYAVQKLPERFDTLTPGNGIWAPSIRYHDGFYWIFVGDPDWGILMIKAKDPAGTWEPIHVVQEGKGLIDTCPLWDDDGKAYLVHAFAGSRAGKKDMIVVQEMLPDGTKLIGEERLVIDGRNNLYPTIEGPKFYKRNGWYYIMAPAGGVGGGYQIAARSKNVFGPYEIKRVLEQGSTKINGPHQGGWVELENGENWFMHFQDRGAYGRLVHLNPVHWVDDWPLMGEDFDKNGIGEPVSTYKKPDVGSNQPIEVPQTSDEFDSGKLNLAWQWQTNPKDNWMSLAARPGWLRLNAIAKPAGNMTMIPNQLLQKFPAPNFKATTRVEIDGNATAALTIMGQTYSALLLSRSGDTLQVQKVTGEKIEATQEGLKGPIWLRVAVEPEAHCTFSYSTDGEKFTTLGEPFIARPGRWIGAKVGIFCTGAEGHADFDWFRIE